MTVRAGVAVWLAAFLLCARPAFAEPLNSAAKRHLDRGVALYAEGRFAQASAELRAGLRVQEHPDLYYALGQAERRRGACKEAVDAYRAFLRSDPPEAEAERAEANIARCEERAAPAVAAPAAAAPAGVPAVGTPTPTPPPRPVAEADGTLRVVGIGVVATGAILFGLGTYFAVRAASNWGTINDAADAHQPWSTDLQRRYESAESSESKATVLFVAGAATAVAGGVLLYLARPSRTARTPLPLGPANAMRMEATDEGPALRVGIAPWGKGGRLSLSWAF